MLNPVQGGHCPSQSVSPGNWIIWPYVVVLSIPTVVILARLKKIKRLPCFSKWGVIHSDEKDLPADLANKSPITRTECRSS